MAAEALERATETDLNPRRPRLGRERHAKSPTAEIEFEAADFADAKSPRPPRKQQSKSLKKARKSERKRKTAAKRRRK